MACDHPASSLKADTAEQAHPGTLKVKFCCLSCLAPLTKEFMLTVPEPEQPASEIGDLLQESEGVAVAPVRRGSNSPWRASYKPAMS